MYKKTGIFCMILGAAMILSAFGLILYNENEDKQAAKASSSVMPLLVELSDDTESSDNIYTVDIEEIPNVLPEAPVEDNTPESEVVSDVPDNSQTIEQSESYIDFGADSNYAVEDLNVTVAKVKGYEYIGYITIPSLNIELPVMADWSYNKLKIAPCRYSGLHYTDNMVIAAHNYKRHFGKISRLEVGDTVIFTDMTGISVFYEVGLTEILEENDIEGMTCGEWDLTLFTCTYGGASRVTVRCDRK